MKNWLKKHNALSVILISYLLLFVPFLGQVHLFDWDEINFAEAAREMLATGDWINVQINFEPFWEKPPLFIWLQAISMHIFGITDFAARFPNVLIGLVTLLVLYFPLLKNYGKQAAVFTLLLYLGSFTPHFYFKSGIIDPLFNLLMYLSVLYLIKATQLRTYSSFFFAGLFLGLAVLAKGPVSILLVGITGLFFQLVFKTNFYTWKNLVVLFVGLLLMPSVYFGVQVYENGWWFIKEFVMYQIDLFQNPVASHGQPFYYHFVVLLIGCFPVFIVAFGSMVSSIPVKGDNTFYRWMKVLFWVVLVVFSLVTTKIVHYSSMCYIPLAIVGGVKMAEYLRLNSFTKVVLCLVGTLWIVVFIVAGSFALPYPFNPMVWIVSVVHDPFVRAQLSTAVEWNLLPLLLSGTLLVSLVHFVRKPTKTVLASWLVTNTLVIAMLMVSFVPGVEQVVQGEWIAHLESYQPKKMTHFTQGFKSYAHRYYTHQQDFDEIRAIKKHVLTVEFGRDSYLKMNQDDKKDFDNAVRTFVIDSTLLPFSLSTKIAQKQTVEARYPNALRLVFSGNGYLVYERARYAH